MLSLQEPENHISAPKSDNYPRSNNLEPTRNPRQTDDHKYGIKRREGGEKRRKKRKEENTVGNIG